MTFTLPLTAEYLEKLNRGDLVRPDQLLGAHVMTQEGPDGQPVSGVRFAVWAPNARHVAVVGDFNGWDALSHPMSPAQGGWGFWGAFVPGAQHGQTYKFAVTGPEGGTVWKADPYAVTAELRPKTASVIWQDQPYEWQDGAWIQGRDQSLGRPMSIYELHVGSWMRGAQGEFMNYRDLAPRIAEYVTDLGYTHVELMGVMEHPFDGSWGYQVTAYYAPSKRFGTPEDFKAFVDILHAAGLGVLLDWVPGHFPTDEFGLAKWDGTPLYEYADPRKGFQYDWNTYVFDYGRNEVQMFLIGSALKWLEDYHLDGLRVDAVASMLYLNFSRTEWIPNIYGGQENLEAIAFFRRLNDAVHHRAPGAVVVAEESTSFPGVTAPTQWGGLGFDYKWAMGWMNDSLAYFEEDPIYRRYDHHKLTFFNVYRSTENFVLAVSHDEVVHGKKSLVSKMPGDWYAQRAGLRAFLGMQWTTPGKKLLFMGQEFAQQAEWNADQPLPLHLLDYPEHRGVHQWVRDLNRVYTTFPALYASDHDEHGLDWLVSDDAEQSVYAFMRRDARTGQELLVVANLTPVFRPAYWVGVPRAGHYRVILSSDDGQYGGYGTQQPDLNTHPQPLHRMDQHLRVDLAPNSVTVLAHSEQGAGAQGEREHGEQE